MPFNPDDFKDLDYSNLTPDKIEQLREGVERLSDEEVDTLFAGLEEAINSASKKKAIAQAVFSVTKIVQKIIEKFVV